MHSQSTVTQRQPEREARRLVYIMHAFWEQGLPQGLLWLVCPLGRTLLCEAIFCMDRMHLIMGYIAPTDQLCLILTFFLTRASSALSM